MAVTGAMNQESARDSSTRLLDIEGIDNYWIIIRKYNYYNKIFKEN